MNYRDDLRKALWDAMMKHRTGTFGVIIEAQTDAVCKLLESGDAAAAIGAYKDTALTAMRTAHGALAKEIARLEAK